MIRKNIMNVLTNAILWILSTSSIYCCQSRSGANNNPVLEFSPLQNSGKSLIWYQEVYPETSQSYKKDLDEFLEPYRNQRSGNAQLCDRNQLPSKNQFCVFTVEKYWAPCHSKYNYGFGFAASGPCIFLKLKVPSGWMPEYYTGADVPAEMPLHLKYAIKQAEMIGEHQKVWVDCTGEAPADIENLGPISYFPSRGFPANYFAHNDVEGYLSPIVAVHFERPNRAVLINVECTAWSKNIRRDREAMLGKVHVELLID